MIFNASQQLYTLSKAARWRPVNAISNSQLDPLVRQWINDKQSLTQRLIDLSNGEFSVDLLQQTVEIPLHHEQDQLGQAHHLAAIVREVCLNVFANPIVLARSIIPLPLIRQHQNGLTNLGRQPLGQLLFKEGEARDERRESTVVDTTFGEVFGRRTPYKYLGETILVSEFYLPKILQYDFPSD